MAKEKIQSVEPNIADLVNGYKDDSGKLQHEIGVYYVSGKNFGYGQEVAKYSDLSFVNG